MKRVLERTRDYLLQSTPLLQHTSILLFAFVDNTMSNKVWVTWKDAAGNAFYAKVTNLDEHADVDDLRTKFVDQQKITVGPGVLSVFETERGAELRASKKLKDYSFTDASDAATQPGPGKSEETALIVQQPNADGPPTKRRKTFDAIVAADKDEALRELRDAANFIVVHQRDTPTSNYCVPNKMQTTWRGDAMREQLIKLRDAIRPKLEKFNEEQRHEIVIGIRLGSGFGKTHAIVEAPTWLNAKGIYTTYNLKQQLEKDNLHPRRALLIRLILIMLGATPRSCGIFLATDSANYFLEDQVTIDLLRELFVHCAKNYSTQDLVIGVDETKELESNNAGIIISELGHIAHAYYKATQLMCTVLVTSLVWENFKTSSGGSVKVWTPEKPDQSAFKWFAEGVTCMGIEQAAALFSAVSGSHMRSLVVAHEALLEHKTPSVASVLLQIEERMGNKLDQNDLESIKQYVISCISDKSKTKVPVDIEASSDDEGAIPPALMCLAFNAKLDDKTHPLLLLLNAFSIYIDSYKQLEIVAKAYDVFRQSLRLGVVPGKANLCFPFEGKGGVQFKDEAWYRALVFPEEMTESQESLIITVKDGATTEKKKHCKSLCTGVDMTGYYFHPKAPNHPLIDRAFVAVHPNGGKCLVVAQDKVNATTFSKAIADLNEAATLLSENAVIHNVLVLVNVIGASDKTKSQAHLNYPYILVRSNEVDDFYSINFAPMVKYARERALLSA
eukprot:scaffold239002_cov62-Attheya_sp.AAC.2